MKKRVVLLGYCCFPDPSFEVQVQEQILYLKVSQSLDPSTKFKPAHLELRLYEYNTQAHLAKTQLETVSWDQSTILYL